MFDVIFYQDKNGNEPIKDLIYELAEKGLTSKNERVQATKILAYIKTLKTYGTRAGYPTVKHIRNDLWELRPLDHRVFFFYWKAQTFVLLHHFVKTTKKTPLLEIEQAERLLADHLERNKA
ncbi:MAG: type II toxin-antitoxin system RelE/ParE family toxin [Oscillospiraceae bacterium]|nr:type II toxin-antitoxin system RelE/ParE family toxin [Oscillospiraceae bacterium]